MVVETIPRCDELVLVIYVADVSREQLESAPSYARDEVPWDDPAYERSVYAYYGMAYLIGVF